MPSLTLQPDGTEGIDTHIIDGAYASLNYATQTQMPIGHQHVLGVDVNCHGLFRFSLATKWGIANIPTTLDNVL